MFLCITVKIKMHALICIPPKSSCLVHSEKHRITHIWITSIVTSAYQLQRKGNFQGFYRPKRTLMDWQFYWSLTWATPCHLKNQSWTGILALRRTGRHYFTGPSCVLHFFSALVIWISNLGQGMVNITSPQMAWRPWNWSFSSMWTRRRMCKAVRLFPRPHTIFEYFWSSA